MPPAAKEEKSDVEKGKKRKNSASVVSTPTKQPKGSLYQDLCRLEESEVASRALEADAEKYIATCQEIKAILKEILELKQKKGHAKATAEITALRVKACVQILILKKLNRLEKLRTRRSRDATNAAKQRVDSFHLQLQNLDYEVQHLQKEVNKCLQFRSKDEDIELVPVDEFYSKAPEAISKPAETRKNDHQQRLARLEWELSQRKELADQRNSLEASKEKLESGITKKEEKLLSLKPQLQAILETTKPVQEYLEMPLDEERSQLQMAKVLPMPLFVLYYQCSGYGRACDNFLKVTIKGDIEEARFLMNKAQTASFDEEEDKDAEDNNEEEVTKKKSRHRMKKSAPKDDERLTKLFAVHPLTVEVEIAEDNGNAILVTFEYLRNLNVVSVKPKLVLNKESKALNGEVLHASTILCHLFADDSGSASPNAATIHQLKRIGQATYPEEMMTQHGYPYYWAQRLSGLDFPKREVSDEDSIDPMSIKADQKLSESQVEDIIKAIRSRLSARLALQRQLTALEKANLISVELTIPPEMASAFPARISCRIRTWTNVDWEQYVSLDVTRHLVEGGAVDQHDFFYRIQVNREPSASLIALVAIKPNYPFTAPVFCLNLHWNGEHNLHNSEYIRALEQEVNLSFADLSGPRRNELLSLQLQRLMACLDVLLEAWSADGSTDVEFPREKLFLQTVRGRNRCLPLKYQPNLQVFSQN